MKGRGVPGPAPGRARGGGGAGLGHRGSPGGAAGTPWPGIELPGAPPAFLCPPGAAWLPRVGVRGVGGVCGVCSPLRALPASFSLCSRNLGQGAGGSVGCRLWVGVGAGGSVRVPQPEHGAAGAANGREPLTLRAVGAGGLRGSLPRPCGAARRRCAELRPVGSCGSGAQAPRVSSPGLSNRRDARYQLLHVQGFIWEITLRLRGQRAALSRKHSSKRPRARS